MARVAHLWRHPIKGHGFEAVAETVLSPGRTMPWDRVWAIAHAAARIAPDDPAWAPSVNFAQGAKSPKLMAIRATVDEAAGRVRLTHPEAAPIEVDPDDANDRARLIAWATPLADAARALPAFVTRAANGMTDSTFPSVSILSLSSLRALSERIGRPLAMQRFRANVWLEGLDPWAEWGWLGRNIRLGQATLRVRERIKRCRATTVDPDTGRTDVDTLGALKAGWGHTDFGLYAEVITGGRVAVGDTAALAG